MPDLTLEQVFARETIWMRFWRLIHRRPRPTLDPGMSRAIQPITDTGWRSYGKGRMFLPPATNRWRR